MRRCDATLRWSFNRRPAPHSGLSQYRRTRIKSGNFQSLKYRKYEAMKFQRGFIDFFMKFPRRDTPYNWICDEMNTKIWNFSQKFNVRPFLLVRSNERCPVSGRSAPNSGREKREGSYLKHGLVLWALPEHKAHSSRVSHGQACSLQRLKYERAPLPETQLQTDHFQPRYSLAKEKRRINIPMLPNFSRHMIYLWWNFFKFIFNIFRYIVFGCDRNCLKENKCFLKL